MTQNILRHESQRQRNIHSRIFFHGQMNHLTATFQVLKTKLKATNKACLCSCPVLAWKAMQSTLSIYFEPRKMEILTDTDSKCTILGNQRRKSARQSHLDCFSLNALSQFRGKAIKTVTVQRLQTWLWLTDSKTLEETQLKLEICQFLVLQNLFEVLRVLRKLKRQLTTTTFSVISVFAIYYLIMFQEIKRSKYMQMHIL